MGKDLKGKELGKGIIQDKSGVYIARFTDNFGTRHSKRFKSLNECRKWYTDSTYDDAHSRLQNPQNLTVKAWFDMWIETKEKTTKPNTILCYNLRYKMDIGPVIGDMLINEVRAIHCQAIFNKMAEKGLANSTLTNTKNVLHDIFETAMNNDIIPKNPCTKVVKTNIGVETVEKEALTRDEHKRFLEAIKGDVYEAPFRFVLQTGLRASEVAGLEWKDIDFDKKTITVRQITYKFVKTGELLNGTPKSKSGYRTIPLTPEAIKLLKIAKEHDLKLKVVPIEWKDHVFLHHKTGVPICAKVYDRHLDVICRKYHFSNIKMHILRHTFATRCIEGGMKPKTLQKIMGHSNITITMNRYVHTTDDEKQSEIERVSDVLSAVNF